MVELKQNDCRKLQIYKNMVINQFDQNAFLPQITRIKQILNCFQQFFN